MSRQKLQMSTIFADQLFILVDKEKYTGCSNQHYKHSNKKFTNNVSNQIKNISTHERLELLPKKKYNNIKAFKHSNNLLHKNMQNLKLSHSTINPQCSNFQNQDLLTINIPQSYKAFPKRQSPLKNNNPAKFFLATQPKKSQQRLQQNSVQMNSNKCILISSSFSNSRNKNDSRRFKFLYSQRRNKANTIESDCLFLQQTISLLKKSREKFVNASARSIMRPKTSTNRSKSNYYENTKDTIQPWENYIQYDHSDTEQIQKKY